MYHVRFIIPYFGTFPATFPYWLQCCKNNPAFSWLILTDDKAAYDFPQNVAVQYTTLGALRERFENALGFSLPLDRAYKLCDFKPLYSVLFKEELQGYSHWGYCDLDILFGDLRSFFTDERLEKFDKVNVLGHMSVLKNTAEVNACYKHCDYKAILQDKKNRIFDEVRFEPNINSLLRANGFSVLPTVEYADVDEEHFEFYLRSFVGKARTVVTSTKPMIFMYRKNRLYKTSIHGGGVRFDEVSYVHFQKRAISVPQTVCSEFLLVPNRIEPYREVSAKDIRRYAKHDVRYFVVHRWKRVKRWLQRLIPCGEIYRKKYL